MEEVKHAGLAGLNKAVSFLGVKKTLNLLRGDLHNTVTDAKAKLEAPAPKQEAKAARPKDREAAL